MWWDVANIVDANSCWLEILESRGNDVRRWKVDWICVYLQQIKRNCCVVFGEGERSEEGDE